MLILLVVMNFAISWFNAWAVGKSWPESKHEGGWAHFMNWMGAVMSACGFTWCYLVIMVTVGSHWDVTDKETGLVHPFLQLETAELVFKLGYTIIILPILGSGLAITVQSWSIFWRRRTLGNGAVAGYNTIAQISNTYDAIRFLPGFVGDLLDAFSKGKSDSKDGKTLMLVVFLVVVALIGGILTTYAILMSSAQEHTFGLKLKAEEARGAG